MRSSCAASPRIRRLRSVPFVPTSPQACAFTSSAAARFAGQLQHHLGWPQAKPAPQPLESITNLVKDRACMHGPPGLVPCGSRAAFLRASESHRDMQNRISGRIIMQLDFFKKKNQVTCPHSCTCTHGRRLPLTNPESTAVQPYPGTV